MKGDEWVSGTWCWVHDDCDGGMVVVVMAMIDDQSFIRQFVHEWLTVRTQHDHDADAAAADTLCYYPCHPSYPYHYDHHHHYSLQYYCGSHCQHIWHNVRLGSDATVDSIWTRRHHHAALIYYDHHHRCVRYHHCGHRRVLIVVHSNQCHWY